MQGHASYNKISPLNRIQKNESLTPTSALVHRCLAAKHPLAKQNWAAGGWPGLTVSNMTGQSNENDDLNQRKCPKFNYDAPG